MKKIKFYLLFLLIAISVFLPTKVNAINECINFSANLRQGQKDSALNKNVYKLQSYLYQEGFLKVSPTGFFGTKTHFAVKALQSKNLLPSTGFVGPLTRNLLYTKTCVNIPNTETPITNEDIISTETPTETVPTVTPPIVTIENPPVDEVLVASNNSAIKVRTDGVVSVYSDSLIVKGTITQGAKSSTERWFELTKNPNEFKKSETKNTPRVPERSNDKRFQDTFIGLEPQTDYYFRACAGEANTNQRSCGGTTFITTN